MDAVDLFAGCGLVTEGLKAAGLRVVLACEWDSWAGVSYQANHPDVGFSGVNLFLYGFREVAHEYGIHPSSPYLVWTSPPCQTFSRSGLKRGDLDVRTRLLFKAVEAGEYLPKAWIVTENVRGLLEERNKPVLERYIRRMEEVGRRTATWELDAKGWGLAANRRRVFLVSSPKGQDEIPECPKPGDQVEAKTLRDVIHPQSGFVSVDPGFLEMTDTELAIYDGIGPGQDWSGCVHGHTYAKRQFGERLEEGQHADFLKRPSWDGVASCVTASAPKVVGARPALLHPEENRFLSLGELRALLGVPEHYHIAGPLLARIEQVGNACPPVLAEAVSASILRAAEISENRGGQAKKAMHAEK